MPRYPEIRRGAPALDDRSTIGVAMHLERWMIDEIVDDDVRVLRAALLDGSPQAAVVEASLSAEWSSQALAAPEAASSANRRLALELEAAPLDGWTPEEEALVDRPRLTVFLIVGAARTARDGLPAREDLREGDVYYVVEPEGDGERTRAAILDLTSVAESSALEAYEAAAVEVWDVTAAARQVMKRLYGEAAFARTDEQPTDEGRARG